MRIFIQERILSQAGYPGTKDSAWLLHVPLSDGPFKANWKLEAVGSQMGLVGTVGALCF